jgi:sugar lactone lactonase YvrE
MPEQLTEALARHGEVPIWDERAKRLCWVDLLAGDLLTMGEGEDSPKRTHVAPVLACVSPRLSGGLIGASERGFLSISDDLETTELAELWSDSAVRMNDGASSPDGRFFAGSMAYDESPGAGALYRLDPDGSVSVIFDDVSISNGLGWTADGTTAYYVDSGTGTISQMSYDRAEGAFADRRTLVAIDPAVGVPDGLCVDADDAVWVALWGGGAVHRYSADGRLDAVLELPITHPTSCCFGGATLETLYITTSSVPPETHDQKGAGALFCAVPGVVGLAEGIYGG